MPHPDETQPAQALTLHLSESICEALETRARQRGQSLAEVLRDAIALEKWVREVAEQGGRILVEKRDGRLMELVVR